MKRAGIYLRLSHDPNGTSEAIERQRIDCTVFAERIGAEIVTEYVDNDISAFDKRKRRPEFERMLDELRYGKIDTVLVYRSDRLARQPRDLELFIDAAEAGRGQLLSVTEPEFSGAGGLMLLRMLVTLGSYESSVKGERVARARRHKAEQGKYATGGKRQFGYTLQGEIVPAEAAVIRDVAERMLAGESSYAIATTLNEADASSRLPGNLEQRTWTSQSLRRMMSSPRLAGIQVYKGAEIGKGEWKPILDEQTWRRVATTIDGRSRPQSPVRRHFLGGLARCGVCGGPLHGTYNKRKGTEFASYSCRTDGCRQVRIVASKLEPVVLERFVHTVTGPDADKLFAALSSGTDSADALAELRELEASMEQLAKDHYVERILSRPEFMAARSSLEDRIEELRRSVRSESSSLTAIPRLGAKNCSPCGSNGRRSVVALSSPR
jgi:site-specific DNA recombinase